MKRVLHISKYYYPFIGGIEQVARDAVRALQGARGANGRGERKDIRHAC